MTTTMEIIAITRDQEDQCSQILQPLCEYTGSDAELSDFDCDMHDYKLRTKAAMITSSNNYNHKVHTITFAMPNTHILGRKKRWSVNETHKTHSATLAVRNTFPRA